MKAFIACVKTDGTKVAKYQDFDTEADAQTHISTYGGFVAAAPSGRKLTRCSLKNREVRFLLAPMLLK